MQDFRILCRIWPWTALAVGGIVPNWGCYGGVRGCKITTDWESDFNPERTRDEAPPGLTALFIPLSWIWRRVPKDRDIWYTKEMEGNV